jgi:hypothetical protein
VVRVRLLNLVAVMAIIALAGCGQPDPVGVAEGVPAATPSAPNADLKPAAVVVEFRQRAEKLTLPPGMSWPAKPPVTETLPGPDGNPETVAYETGYGVMLAEDYWFCSWALEWLRTRSTEHERAQAAVVVLRSFKNTFDYQKAMDKTTKDYIDGLVEKAGLDDPAEIGQHVQGVNCNVLGPDRSW